MMDYALNLIICGCFAHFVMNITVQWSMSRKTAFITSTQHLTFKLNIMSRSEYVTHPNRKYWHSNSISISHNIDIQPNIISRLPMRTSERSIRVILVHPRRIRFVFKKKELISLLILCNRKQKNVREKGIRYWIIRKKETITCILAS